MNVARIMAMFSGEAGGAVKIELHRDGYHAQGHPARFTLDATTTPVSDKPMSGADWLMEW